jgi:hypothetical protein
MPRHGHGGARFRRNGSTGLAIAFGASSSVPARGCPRSLGLTSPAYGYPTWGSGEALLTRILIRADISLRRRGYANPTRPGLRLSDRV